MSNKISLGELLDIPNDIEQQGSSVVKGLQGYFAQQVSKLTAQRNKIATTHRPATHWTELAPTSRVQREAVQLKHILAVVDLLKFLSFLLSQRVPSPSDTVKSVLQSCTSHSQLQRLLRAAVSTREAIVRLERFAQVVASTHSQPEYQGGLDEGNDANQQARRLQLHSLLRGLSDPLHEIGNRIRSFSAAIASAATQQERRSLYSQIPAFVEHILNLVKEGGEIEGADEFSDALFIAAIEDELYASIHPIVLELVQAEQKEENLIVAKQMSRCKGLSQEDLHVPLLYCSSSAIPYYNATALLRTLTMYKTPSRKIQVIRSTATLILKEMEECLAPREEGSTQAPMLIGGDDFVPVFVYVLLQANIPQLATECFFIRTCLPDVLAQGEVGYYCTTFELATEYVKTISFSTSEQGGGTINVSKPEIIFVMPQMRKARQWAANSSGRLKIVAEDVPVSGFAYAIVEEFLLEIFRPFQVLLQENLEGATARVSILQTTDFATDSQKGFIEKMFVSAEIPGISCRQISCAIPKQQSVETWVLVLDNPSDYASYVSRSNLLASPRKSSTSPPSSPTRERVLFGPQLMAAHQSICPYDHDVGISTIVSQDSFDELVIPLVKRKSMDKYLSFCKAFEISDAQITEFVNEWKKIVRPCIGEELLQETDEHFLLMCQIQTILCLLGEFNEMLIRGIFDQSTEAVLQSFSVKYADVMKKLGEGGNSTAPLHVFEQIEYLFKRLLKELEIQQTVVQPFHLSEIQQRVKDLQSQVGVVNVDGRFGVKSWLALV